MPVYDINGKALGGLNAVAISELKAIYPDFTDDQLLEEAISQAQEIGKTAVIIWDGTDIHFSGQVTHICSGFGGIDFNWSKIYMPNYDNGIILQVEPDSSTEITVSASNIFEDYTTSDSLKGKVFMINGDVTTGNSGMCLGTRQPAASFNNAVLYSRPVVKATPDGFFATGSLFLVPSSGNVVCGNVHDIPTETFEIKNAEIISYAGSNMSTLAFVKRSNTHVHHFNFTGRSSVTVYHDGPFKFSHCSDIEIDHLYGVNPVQQANTSGYVFSLNSISCAHVHDVAIGDRTGWGAVGCGNLTNTVWERCYMDRFDCHYAQYGYNVIRDCLVNHIQYGIGNGTLVFENCTVLLNKDATSSVLWFAELRSDTVGVYNGDIIFKNCIFLPGKQTASKTGILNDSCSYALPSNSSFNMAPKKNRFVSKCQIPDGCKYVFQTGTGTTADQPMFANLTYAIEGTVVGSGTTKIHPLGSGQTVTEVQSSDYYGKLN